LPIVRGIKKKAAEREVRELQEAKEAGLILPSQTLQAGKKKKEKDKTSRIHGPAPTIGFMKKGIFSYKDKKT
jgi:predicted ATPase